MAQEPEYDPTERTASVIETLIRLAWQQDPHQADYAAAIAAFDMKSPLAVIEAAAKAITDPDMDRQHVELLAEAIVRAAGRLRPYGEEFLEVANRLRDEALSAEEAVDGGSSAAGPGGADEVGE